MNPQHLRRHMRMSTGLSHRRQTTLTLNMLLQQGRPLHRLHRELISQWIRFEQMKTIKDLRSQGLQVDTLGQVAKRPTFTVQELPVPQVCAIHLLSDDGTKQVRLDPGRIRSHKVGLRSLPHVLVVRVPGVGREMLNLHSQIQNRPAEMISLVPQIDRRQRRAK